MTIEYPERIELANTPTPLQRLQRTSQQLGVELWIKRDDLTGCELSGNKVRKLEFLFARARELGVDTVITGGGEQSNHCRATAMAAARLGLRCRLLLRTIKPAVPPKLTANILLDKLAGADIRWIDHDQWKDRAALFAEEAAAVNAAGGSAYIIPEGGSNATGAWGYVRAAEELHNQLAELPSKATTVVYACGSGGTGAGLILGKKLLGAPFAVAGINVCDDRAYFVDAIGSICRDFIEQYKLELQIDETDIEIVDGHVGLGYAKSRPAELETIRDLCRREGIVLDPVYSGKAWHGMLQELATDRARFGERIVFVHTGGIFGLFAASEAFADILRART